MGTWIKEQNPSISCFWETHIASKDMHRMKVKGWNQLLHAMKSKKKKEYIYMYMHIYMHTYLNINMICNLNILQNGLKLLKVAKGYNKVHYVTS
jgi:hypothetical protein